MTELERSLPFELPDHLQGLEELIATQAKDMGGDFKQACGAAAMLLDQRLRGYSALARGATNPDSLPYKLRDDPNTWHPPEPFNPTI